GQLEVAVADQGQEVALRHDAALETGGGRAVGQLFDVDAVKHAVGDRAGGEQLRVDGGFAAEVAQVGEGEGRDAALLEGQAAHGLLGGLALGDIAFGQGGAAVLPGQ